MAVFKISESLVMARMFAVEAATPHEAMEMFHNGEAAYYAMVPAANKPLVELTVIDENGVRFSEDALMLSAGVMGSPAEVETVQPQDVENAAMGALSAAFDDEDGEPNYKALVSSSTLYEIPVCAASEDEAEMAAKEIFTQSADPNKDFRIVNCSSDLQGLIKIPA